MRCKEMQQQSHLDINMNQEASSPLFFPSLRFSSPLWGPDPPRPVKSQQLGTFLCAALWTLFVVVSCAVVNTQIAAVPNDPCGPVQHVLVGKIQKLRSKLIQMPLSFWRTAKQICNFLISHASGILDEGLKGLSTCREIRNSDA